ncbi:hypothetical protein D6C91_10517 [Aureobasidium pullulans]|uniref:Uncharacterized protein n=1 Tax=Aureobasidium pullulans TaxID=5580 RepID=A0A4S9S301_AURPU|nr:hypothetical protein D6C91_10517 [Aureobasidium pullulans]
MAGKKNNKATGKPKALTMSSSSPIDEDKRACIILQDFGIETYSKSVGGIRTNTPQTPEEKAAELAALDQNLYKVQLATNESMSLVPWREDRVHIAPVTDIIDSISRATPITPLDVRYVPYTFPDQVDVVYINTSVTGGLICHQGLQDAHNLDTYVYCIPCFPFLSKITPSTLPFA